MVGQSFKNWKLLIHDDGSNDNTVPIIKSWQEFDSRICLIDDGQLCGGAAENFMHLLRYSTAEYVMFCDQDDIWFDNKIQVMFDAMIKEDDGNPRVVYSNSYVWKPLEGIKGMATLTFPSDLKSFLFLNSGMQGCVAMFNVAVRAKMLHWDCEVAMHDHLLHLIGITMGTVVYLPYSLMLYRNHEKNVTGGTNTQLVNLERIKNNRKVPVVDKDHYAVIDNFVRVFRCDIVKCDMDLFGIYLSLPQKTLISRVLDVIKYRFKLYDSMTFLVVKMLLRPYN